MITCNLFDETFRQATCSTAYQEPRQVRYVRDRLEWDGITLFTDGHIVNGMAPRVNSRVKLGWLHEPECLYPDIYRTSVQHLDEFDAILTYSQHLLDHPSGKYQFMPYAGVWIPSREWGLRPKTKLVSMLYGTKTATAGHRLRHEIANLLGYDHGIDYFGYRGQSVDYSWQTKLRVLGDYCFSIVVETCRDDNLFTEILLDCFAVGTIPIFWGAPNIGDFFNRRGMLPFDDPRHLSLLLNLASFDLYHCMRPAVEDNLKRVRQYAVAEDWMHAHVLRRYA